MKADHQSKQYQMEDNLLKYFPEQIEKHKGFIKGLEADMETLAAHPHPEDSFAGMEGGAIPSPTRRTPVPPFWMPARK